jgi:hypothetical protein
MMKKLALFSLLFVWSCEKDMTTVNVAITVKDNQNEAIEKAKVFFNQREMGETDQAGKLNVSAPYLLNDEVTVAVKKDSDSFYYAPYYSKFMVYSQDTQDVSVEATLYSVPKPDFENIGETAQADANKATVEGLNEAARAADASKVLAEESSADEQSEVPLATPPAPAPVVDGTKTPEAATEAEIPLTIFTLFAYSNGKAIEAAKIYLGQKDGSNYKFLCATNPRGRCVAKFKDAPQGEMSFLAKKEGFQTARLTGTIEHLKQIRFNLKAGLTLDIFAVTKAFEVTTGLAGVSVFVAGEKKGFTDKMGQFSYYHEGDKEDLIEVTLVTQDYLPIKYSTDFVVSESMNLVKYFAPVQPPKPRLTLLDTRTSGGGVAPTEYQPIAHAIQDVGENTLFKALPFVQTSRQKFDEALTQDGIELAKAMREGWDKTALKSLVDALIVPTISTGDHPFLELKIIDSSGKVIAAGKSDIELPFNKTALNASFDSLARQIIDVYPFEGAITAKSGENYKINIGHDHGLRLNKGDIFEIQGTQTDRMGKARTHKKIGTAKVIAVDAKSATIRPIDVEPRASVEVGDFVILRSRQTSESSVAKAGPSKADDQAKLGRHLKVIGLFANQTTPIAQANVYADDKWIGATDNFGILPLGNDIKKSATLKVVKEGYQSLSAEMANLSANPEIKLVKETAFIQINSQPTGAIVKIEGKIVGKTPLTSPLAVPSGFVRVELSGIEGYKTFSQIMELDEGTLALVGKNSIKLEEDLMQRAMAVQKKGDFNDAAAILTKIGPEHSDYLLAQHNLGMIYLNQQNNPVKAATAFHNVTSKPEVASFNDKRFISSHVNEGLALFFAGRESFKRSPDLASQYFQKAIQKLDEATPHLRFMAKDELLPATHHVKFYKALSFQNLWQLSKEEHYLTLASKSWEEYLANHAKDPDVASIKPLIEDAKIYYKQAQSLAKIPASRSGQF